MLRKTTYLEECYAREEGEKYVFCDSISVQSIFKQDTANCSVGGETLFMVAKNNDFIAVCFKCETEP